MTAQIELIARQAAASTSTCRTFEPDVCDGCNGRLEAARATAHAIAIANQNDPSVESAEASLREVERRLRGLDGYSPEDARRMALLHIQAYWEGRANVTTQPAISAEQVEAMARDLYEEEANDSDGFDSWPGWDSHDNITRDIWRHRVDSMLRAAGLTVAGESQ